MCVCVSVRSRARTHALTLSVGILEAVRWGAGSTASAERRQDRKGAGWLFRAASVWPLEGLGALGMGPLGLGAVLQLGMGVAGTARPAKSQKAFRKVAHGEARPMGWREHRAP